MYDARLCVCLTLPVSKVVMMIFLVGSVDLWHINLPSASCRTRKAKGVIQPKSEGLRTEELVEGLMV